MCPSQSGTNLLLPAALPLLVTACASTRTNPSFPVTVDEAAAAIREMQQNQTLFPRPVVVAAGDLGSGSDVQHIGDELRRMTPDPHQLIVVSFFSVSSFESSRTRCVDPTQQGW